MRFSAVFAIAFAALASAIPYAVHDHAHGHQVAHGKQHRGHGPQLAGRSASHDGSCGSWSGASCPAGFCCGPNGWCGKAAEHCGAGCQSGFGDCGAGASALPLSSSKQSASTTTSSTITESSSSVRVISTSSSETAELSTSAPSSVAEPSSLSISVSLVNKAPDDRPRHGRPSYGEPQPTLITKTLPGQSSSADSGASSQPAEPSISAPALPSSSAYAPPFPSSEPTGPATPSSVPAPSSAEPTTATSASSSYDSAAPSPTSGGGSGDAGDSGDSGNGSEGGAQSQGGSYIKTYRGTGATTEGWPRQNRWLSFDNLWNINQDIMKNSCSNAFSQVDNSEQELADIRSSIEDVSASTGIDKAFIFAIMMQESNGCVRVQTTAWSHANQGLFQSHQGEGSCNDGSGVQNPCPQSEIHQMVEDGVAGTSAGDGLKQLLAKATGQGAQKYYQAARMYNSGSLDPSGNLGLGVATHCYCSDIANRLTGWSAGVSQCDAATVGA